MLSEISQTQKNNYHMFSLICRSYKRRKEAGVEGGLGKVKATKISSFGQAK
jgi:hypothetical protein